MIKGDIYKYQMHREKKTKLPGLAKTLFIHTKKFAPHQPHWCSAGTSPEPCAGGRQCLHMTADVHATLGGSSPLSKKVPNEACQTKPLTKQCAAYVQIIHIFCYGQIDTFYSSTLNGVTETWLHQMISIPFATAHGQQGTGLCRNLVWTCPSKPTASSRSFTGYVVLPTPSHGASSHYHWGFFYLRW